MSSMPSFLIIINRYSCIRLQYLSDDETNYVTDRHFWMVTKCDPDYLDRSIVEQCEQSTSTLQAMVPVTEPVANVHFR